MNYCIREKKLYFLWTLTVFGIIGQKYFTDSVLVSLRIAQCPMLKMVLFIQESLIKIDCFYLYLSIIPHKNKTNSVCNLCTAVQHPSEYCNHVQYRNIRVEDPKAAGYVWVFPIRILADKKDNRKCWWNQKYLVCSVTKVQPWYEKIII